MSFLCLIQVNHGGAWLPPCILENSVLMSLNRTVPPFREWQPLKFAQKEFIHSSSTYIAFLHIHYFSSSCWFIAFEFNVHIHKVLCQPFCCMLCLYKNRFSKSISEKLKTTRDNLNGVLRCLLNFLPFLDNLFAHLFPKHSSYDSLSIVCKIVWDCSLKLACLFLIMIEFYKDFLLCYTLDKFIGIS